jgi:hypothetical protein
VSTTEVLLTTSSTNYQDPLLSGLEHSSTTTPLSTQPTQNEYSSEIINASVTRDKFDSLNIRNTTNIVGNSSLFSTIPFQNYQSNDFDFEIPNLSTCQLPKPDTFEIISKNITQTQRHNSSISNCYTMEGDCTDSNGISSVPNMQDLTQLLSNLSLQIMSQNRQLSNDVHEVVERNDEFKKEVRSEFDELRALIWDIKNPSSTQNPKADPSTPVLSTLSAAVPTAVTSTSVSAHLTSALSNQSDQQSKMMLLFANSISKLSSVLGEKSESKSDWPKFSGDQKKFRAWYHAIMAQISLPPWAEFYDSSKHDVVTSASNSTLNGKLYSKLLLALEGQVLQSIVSRKHLHANGLKLLQELVQAYKPWNVPEVIAFKTSEFWGNTKRFQNESIDDYYNRFQDLLEDLTEADEPISTKSAIRHFIFTLGSEFETIQNNF